jgi:D-amino peptidase
MAVALLPAFHRTASFGLRRAGSSIKEVEMRKLLVVLFLVCLLAAPAAGQMEDGLKVFISVDMEGISGVVTPSETSRSGMDYGYFRRVMTEETNAAIEGALAAGATEIVVRDSHGSARNILPEQLNRNALLLRDWSGGHLSMMEGIDDTFDAVIFIGYHAKAGTANAIIDHTSSGNVTNVEINGISMPEAGYNALMAGYYGVPVVFVAGDQAITEQVKERFGEVETVAVKKGIGAASLGLHPEVAREKIRAGVEHALRNLDNYQPYELSAPYTLVLTMKTEQVIYDGALYPGAERTGDWELTFVSDDLMEVMRAYQWMRK